MASEIDDIKDSWKTERQEWQEKVSSLLGCIWYTR